MRYRYDKLLESCSPDLRTLLFSESRPHASAWKTAPATPSFIMDGRDFQLVVRRALRVEIFTSPLKCDCGHVIDSFGDHCLHCMLHGGVVQRHNDAYRLIAGLARDAYHSVEIESTKTFPDGSTYRPDLVMTKPIPGLTLRKTACDLTITNGFAPYLVDITSKRPGEAIEQGIKRKIRNVDVDALDKQGYDFLPFSFEETGGFDSKTERFCFYLLNEKAKLRNRVLSEVCAEFWQSLSLSIHRSNSHMIRNKLSVPRVDDPYLPPGGMYLV